jgi:2-polyprenyl-3-methyl-5-hydroxy-6-metoxy-1,4-benzoquinol methylase
MCRIRRSKDVEMKGHRPLNTAYDGCPAEYDRKRACWLNERRFGFLAGRLGSEPPGRVRNVLEIGSGTGWLLRRLAALFPDVTFRGVEPRADYVEFARSNSTAPNVKFLAGTAESVDTLALPPVDVVLSNDVLHHVERMDLAVAAVSGVAGPNCVWHAIEPNWLNAYSLLLQAVTPGERVFWPWQFSALARRRQWQEMETARLFLIPPFVGDAPEWLKTLERKVEWIPFIAGGIYQRFQLRCHDTPQ